MSSGLLSREVRFEVPARDPPKIEANKDLTDPVLAIPPILARIAIPLLHFSGNAIPENIARLVNANRSIACRAFP
jgi:hypothetical protein